MNKKAIFAVAAVVIFVIVFVVLSLTGVLKTTSVKEDSNIEGRKNDQDSGTITRYSDNLNSNSSSFQSYPTNIMSTGFSGSQFQSDSTTFVDGFVRSEES